MSDPLPPPTWHPISQLPVIAWAITGMAESATEQRGHLRQAEDRPHVLDNQTVDRVIASYTQQQSDLWLYAVKCQLDLPIAGHHGRILL